MHRGAPAGWWTATRAAPSASGSWPTLYPDSPDGRPTIGSEDEIAGLTRDSAMDFYRAHYAPEQRDPGRRRRRRRGRGPADGRAALRADPGVGADRAAAERPQEPPLGGGPPIEVHDARVAVPQLTRLYLAPQRRAGDQKQAAALVVLADLLGGQRVTSLMARELMGPTGSPSAPRPPTPTPGSTPRPSASRGAEARRRPRRGRGARSTR